jgi:hypothetical protein
VLWFGTNEEVVYVRPDQATFNIGCSGLKVGRIVKVIFRHITTNNSSRSLNLPVISAEADGLSCAGIPSPKAKFRECISGVSLPAETFSFLFLVIQHFMTPISQ